MDPVARPFDLCGPLPEGTTVLEASAGTGKTYTIAALVARFVAEGVAGLDQMLIVTFSRAATGELRERVRERLTSAELGLADPAAAREGSGDGLLALLAEAPDPEVALRRARLRQALTAFDAATIATTHQFCAQVLAGLGVTAELAALSGGDRFVESLDDLVTEVTEDLYVRKFAGAGPPDEVPGIRSEEARLIAVEAVLREPHARLGPRAAPADSPAGMRRRLAEAVRDEVTRRKRRRGLRSYDDLQTDLAAVLRHPQQGPPAARRLRQRYPVVLIDEFQDTDPVQWEIVSTAFVDKRGSSDPVRLVLIGDPKQAIYGFRGADVTAYLAAVAKAEEVATLERNWRSQPDLIEAFDALFGDCTFGDARIVYRPVQAARRQPTMRGGRASAPLRLRVVTRSSGDPLSGSGQLRVEALRPRIARDVAADIVGLLSSDAEIVPAAEEGEPAFRAVQPGDVAVLVRTNAQATQVRDALREAAVPAVIGGASSVFTAPIAQDWLILLEALEQPHRTGRVRAAAMTRFLSWSAARLALADPEETDSLSALLRSWAGVLAAKGVAALQETIMSSQQLPAKLLAEPDGERSLTDLRHIGESLHAAATADGLGITALVAWLRRRMEEADDLADGVEERSRRLDSDADAVQVVTIHRSKGLQFPVVYVPFGWDLFLPEVERPRYHDKDGERVLDVGGGLGGSDPAAFAEGQLRHRTEEAGEQLRLLYVAVTRARSQVVLWWAPATTAERSPLSRLLFGLQPGGAEPSAGVAIPGDGEIEALLTQRFATAADVVRLEAACDGEPMRWAGSLASPGELRAAAFGRELDLAWRRTSYSGLTAAAHDSRAGSPAQPMPSVGSEPESAGLDDEPAEPDVSRAAAAPAGDPASAVLSPMGSLPGGTAFGSLVHGVLETVDTQAADLAAEVGERVAEQLSRWAPAASATVDSARLAAALMAVYETQLGPAAGGLRLRDIGASDRLTELGFELPLCGGDQPTARLVLGSLGPLVSRHLADAAGGGQDPLAAFGERLTEPLLREQSLRGFLSGSLDAVLRLRDDRGSPRYVVVDYKTNWLSLAAPGSGQLTAADYTPARLAAAMLDSDYPLQALLYSVALHRYLRWRQPGYEPEIHLGGVLYLYLRGMCGPETPVIDGQPCGVFAWKPPAALVTELSDALDTGQVPR